MLFKYNAVDKSGGQREGTVDAANVDAAINSLQRRGYVVSSIDPLAKATKFLNYELTFFSRVSHKEIVIFSRQIATLFEAQVSALRVFRLLAAETENDLLRNILTNVADDIQGGSPISSALARHPDTFSSFYVNMVKAGEESGKLDAVFGRLADHLDRTYELVSRARNALIYPVFVIVVFVVVMMLMMTLVIPRISEIILQSGQEIPVFTKIVIGISTFLTNYIGLVILFVAILGFLMWRFIRTEIGARAFDEFKLSVPYIGTLYTKMFLARISDNLSIMLASGISMVKALEITADVVDNRVFKEVLNDTISAVKGGRSVSDALGEHEVVPGVLTQMVKVGEETGNLSSILGTLSKFYRREVNTAVDTLINLIEPAMIVLLGLGVGVLLTAILMPIYNISAGI